MGVLWWVVLTIFRLFDPRRPRLCFDSLIVDSNGSTDRELYCGLLLRLQYGSLMLVGITLVLLVSYEREPCIIGIV